MRSNHLFRQWLGAEPATIHNLNQWLPNSAMHIQCHISHKQLETHRCVFSSQHYRYWCSGAKAPGHQCTQCWLNIHCIGPFSYRNITLKGNNVIYKIKLYFERKNILSFKGSTAHGEMDSVRIWMVASIKCFQKCSLFWLTICSA